MQKNSDSRRNKKGINTENREKSRLCIKKIADLFGSFVKSAYICIINKGDKLTSSPLSKFEIVFSSLYKFCEGMFRRETVHSHFFAPNSEVYDGPITSGQQANEKEHI